MLSSRANQGSPDATPFAGDVPAENSPSAGESGGAGGGVAHPLATPRGDNSAIGSGPPSAALSASPGLRQLASDAEEFHLPLDLVEVLAAGIVDAGEREDVHPLKALARSVWRRGL